MHLIRHSMRGSKEEKGKKLSSSLLLLRETWRQLIASSMRWNDMSGLARFKLTDSY